MARFTAEDKKRIAQMQRQVVYEEREYQTGLFSTQTRRYVIGYKCKGCRRVFDLDIMEVDHIYPQSRRGSDRPSNLQLLCPVCNRKKGSKVRKTSTKTTAKPRKTASASRKPKRKVKGR
jgi:5-methylcytosine-specific restriction endonuclease McrA